MNENGLVNIYKHKNAIDPKELANTYKYGSKCIDIAMCTYEILEYIAKSQLTECDKVILNNHRGYLVNVEF